jgi:cyclopropane fatty-acyl-phospholipid synthase-like methyltransferase
MQPDTDSTDNDRSSDAVVADHFEATAAEFDAIYSGEKSPLARWLDRTLRSSMFTRLDRTLERLRPVKGLKVLDVGTGSGRLAIPLARESAYVVGIDPAPSMIRIAERISADAGVSERCRFETGAIGDPLKEKFDVAVLLGIFDYFPSSLPALRWLADAGVPRVIATYPRARILRAYIRTVRLKLRGCPVFFYTPETVRNEAAEAGYDPEYEEIMEALLFVDMKLKSGGKSGKHPDG